MKTHRKDGTPGLFGPDDVPPEAVMVYDGEGNEKGFWTLKSAKAYFASAEYDTDTNTITVKEGT